MPVVSASGIGWRQPHYAELLERRPSVGFLEVHSENFYADGGPALRVLEAGRARHAVSLHGVGLALGSARGLDPWHVDRLARLVERIEPVRVSDHACFARAAREAGGAVIHANDLLPIAFNEASLGLMCRHVQQVQERLRRPILVENVAAYVAWRDATLGEAEFLGALASRTGCGLLLDVNNLYVNALNDRPPFVDGAAGAAFALSRVREFIDALEPHGVGEIHVAGHRDLGAIVIDDHGDRVAEPVWDALAYALARFGADVPVLVEWDTEVPALDVLLAEAAHADAIGQGVRDAASRREASARDGALTQDFAA
jgi:hypothetical protein